MKVTGYLAVVGMIAALAAGALNAAPPQTGYADGTYYYGTQLGMHITNFVLKRGTTTLMSNASGASASPYNTFYGSVTPGNLVPGQQHSVELTIGQSYPVNAVIWIDYDNNGAFNDTNERVAQITTINNGATGTLTFTPPTGVGGLKRMRIRTEYYGYSPATSATVQCYYGEVEDYLVNMGFALGTGSPLPTGAVNSAYNTVITATNGTTPYNWQGNPTYLIAGSLPPGLTAAPQGSPNFGLVISGTPTTTGVYNFTVRVLDSKSPTPDQAQGDYQITVVPPPAALPFNDDFSTFTGWQLGSTWQRSVAVAYTATSPNREEPGTDHTAATTDNFILGDTIGGNYTINMSGTNWAVSPMVNCSTATTVRLSFWRFMGLALDCPNGGGTIQVTNNGTTWTNVWQSTGGTTYKDTAWTSVYYDLTSVAAGAATVQVRFGIGPTGATLHTGWCIDDLKIEQPGPDMVVREGGPTGAIITDNQAVGGARDFGQINASTVSAPLNLYITNNGPANITFGAYTKTGAQPNDFYINTSSFVNPLPVGQSTTITITFYRTTVGISTATFNLPHNATGSGTSPFEVNLKGEAIVPNPDIEVRLGSATGPVIPHNQSPTGTPRDFGNQDINAGPSGSITIFIKNTGTGQLNISTPDTGGNWWNQFVVDSTGLQSGLTAGQSTTFTVAFDPTSVGSKDAYVRLPHTDTGQPSPYYIPVLGNGTTSTVAGMTVSEGTAPGAPFTHNAAAAGLRDFGNQLVAGGATPAITINILSSGGVALNVACPRSVAQRRASSFWTRPGSPLVPWHRVRPPRSRWPLTRHLRVPRQPRSRLPTTTQRRPRRSLSTSRVWV
ncbi:MAG: choice-of-anchor D domain-containing protein [Planctomycetes bacterium]|nr:choice-of-anchor D domain-containing protein [Planctomycetota bacterium]